MFVLTFSAAIADAPKESISEFDSREYDDPRARGFATVLDDGIKKKLLEPENVTEIMGIQHCLPFETEKYSYLFLSISLWGDFGFEGAWHGHMLTRKKLDAEDWALCELFHANSFYPLEILPELTDEELLGLTSEHFDRKYLRLSQAMQTEDWSLTFDKLVTANQEFDRRRIILKKFRRGDESLNVSDEELKLETERYNKALDAVIEGH